MNDLLKIAQRDGIYIPPSARTVDQVSQRIHNFYQMRSLPPSPPASQRLTGPPTGFTMPPPPLSIQIKRLPPEVQLSILSNMEPEQLKELCSTDRYFNQLCQDEMLWNNLTQNRFTGYNQPSPGSTWKDEYKFQYQLEQARLPTKEEIIFQIPDVKPISHAQYIGILKSYKTNLANDPQLVQKYFGRMAKPLTWQFLLDNVGQSVHVLVGQHYLNLTENKRRRVKHVEKLDILNYDQQFNEINVTIEDGNTFALEQSNARNGHIGTGSGADPVYVFHK